MFYCMKDARIISRHKSAAAAERKARELKKEEARKYWLVSEYEIFEEKPEDASFPYYGFESGSWSISTPNASDLAEWASKASDPQVVRGRFIKFI